MASSEKPIVHHNQQQQQQRQQQVLIKCPRCNSLNTKFCYYNNYSLSQPRHFCKSCKRYWTRGGTLRNVPIGGGCRKKKRIKRGFTAVDDHTPNPNPNLDLDLDLDHSTPLYELLQRNPKYPRFNHRVSDHASSYDLVQPQMSSLGLGFSSSDHNSAPLVSNNPSMFSGGLITSICNSDHNISSLLASNIQQQPTSFLGFVPYADGGGSVVNNVPMEEQKNSMGWNTNGQNINNDHIFKGLESSDPTSFIWNITGGEGGAWHDPTSNVSVPSI